MTDVYAMLSKGLGALAKTTKVPFPLTNEDGAKIGEVTALEDRDGDLYAHATVDPLLLDIIEARLPLKVQMITAVTRATVVLLPRSPG